MKLIRPLTITDSILDSSNVPENEYSNWSSSTVYAIGTTVQYVATDVHKVYESKVGSSFTFTVTIASPAVFTATAHGQVEGTPISFATTGALPTGIVAGTVYYVKSPAADTFNIAATVGGAAINTSGTQSGTHTATASSNYNKNPTTNPTEWTDLGATNTWAMFDEGIASQTTRADLIDVTLDVTGRVDGVALLNLDALSVQVTVTDATDGVVYDESVDLTVTSGINDWYSYFFEPIVKKEDIVFTDMPAYANTSIQIQVVNTGGTAACGVCVVGHLRDIGETQVNAKVGINDYSIKTRDDFGSYLIVERAFNKRGNFTIYCESSSVDLLFSLLSQYRATPVVYIGDENFGATIVYGFYKSFEVDISYYDGLSVCSLELEGLT